MPTSLCLLKYADHFFIGYIDLPQKEWTIEKYDKWHFSYTRNLHCISYDYTPQDISNGGMDIICCVGEIVNELNGYNGCFEIAFSYKELLKRLELVSDKKYESCFYNYIKEMHEQSKLKTV